MLKKKIQKLEPHLRQFGAGKNVFVVLPDAAAHQTQVKDVGLSFPLQPGEHVLPAASFGKASGRNAEGFVIVHRDKPKETHFRQKPWTWNEFHGREKIERSGIVDVPYKRYPRTTVPAYGIELQVRPSLGNRPLVVAGPFVATHDNEALLNTVHLFVELFGECVLAGADLYVAQDPPPRQLNWEILPPGKRPWEETDSVIGRAIAKASASDQIVINSRLAAIRAYEPDFCATGRHGFTRYAVYGWDKQQVYILESTDVDNATYVLKRNWEVVSAMTKAEVLHENAHHARLIHRKSWGAELSKLMKSEGIQPKL
jgi:hypothetical protein